jgi:hypothetical protein
MIMATLERPGVNIKQVITPASPTVLTPTLVPCVVGPCYQIVEPLAGGALNPNALITTAAVLEADAAHVAPATLSGTTFKVTVNGTLETVVFPVIGGAGGFSQALIVNTLNAGLSLAYAEYGTVDNILRISTLAKGAAATIVVQNIGTDAGNTAAPALLFTTNQSVSGKAQYQNLTYEVPYSSLPSPLADVDDVVFDEDELSLYKYFGNVLVNLSEDSAIDWTSYIPKEATAAADMHNATSNWRPVALHALQTSSNKTNKIQNWGTEASVIFPLDQDSTVGGSVAVANSWPDASGGNYLRVTAKRLNATTGVKGALAGAAGNTIRVVRAANGGAGPAASVTVVWASPTLTITPKDNNVTFDTLQAAVDAAMLTAAVTDEIEIDLNFNTGSGALVCLAGVTAAASYAAHGGSDPDDFGIDAAALSQYASVTGAVDVGGAAPTATSLGIGGMTLSLSFDGGEWIDCLLVGGTSILTSINNAVKAALSVVVDVATIRTVDLPEVLPAQITGRLLQIHSELLLGYQGADSTIEMKASDPLVLEQLFGGYQTRTDTIAAADSPNGLITTNAWGGGVGVDGRRPIILGGTHYNTLSLEGFDRSVVPGSLTIKMTNLTVNGFIACTVAGGVADFAHKLDITHSGIGAATTISPAVAGLTTPALIVADLAAKLAASPLATKVQVNLLNGQIIFSEMTGVAGANFTLDSGGATTGLYLAYLRGVVSVDPFDTTVTTIVTGEATLSDTSTGAWQVTGVSAATLASSISNPAFTETAAELTALMLDTSCSFNYPLGASQLGATEVGSILFSSQLDLAIAAPDRTALILSVTKSTSAEITYERTRPNLLGAFAPSGQTSPILYGGRIFQGRSNAIEVGDTLYEAGTVKGKVMAIESANAWTNNILVLSDFTVDNGSSLTQWYVRAENLTSTSSRVLPEVVVDTVGETVTAKHALNRNINGIPTPSRSLAPMYVGYKALRTDVSAAATNPALLAFASLDEVETIIGPITPQNPLAFALRTAFLHTTDIVVAALGIGETTADAPNGTVDSYIEALDFLELKEVYGLAPLSQDKSVHDIFSTHVTAMSAETGRKERVAFVNLALPTEEAPASCVTGLMKIGAAWGPNSTKYTLTFQGANPADAKSAIGANDDAAGTSLLGLETFSATNGVYLEREGDAYKYLVVGVSSDGTEVTIDVDDVYGPGGGPATGGNSDAYFRTTAPASFEADGEQCGIWVRQAAIDSTTTAGRLKICETLADLTGSESGYQNRRLFFSQPEQLGIDYNGSETLVPGYHACVADVARAGQLSPSQPFTNLPYSGFTRVVGSSDKFSENQMATAAAGGVWWVIQDVPGGSLTCRHQLSTDVSTLKLREFSITRSVDYVAKVIRAQTRRFIGRNNITKALLDMLGLSLQAALSSVIGPVVQGASIDSIAQNASNPDQVDVTVSVTVYYPCNKITITIVA